ncbi:MAG: hypothetical protein K2Q22_00275, partial [Cytophagales bacterium]|nr:hypothetical protein [Cytophagales bacterium]
MSASAYSQGCFYAVSTTGCVPFTVNLVSCATVTSGTGNIEYEYNYPNSSQSTPLLTFTYTAPGIYSIRQTGNFPGLQNIRSNYITVLDKPAPKYTIRSCNDKEIRVYPSGPYQKYTIDYGDGNSQTINSGAFFSHKYLNFSTQTLTLTGIYIPSQCSTSTIFNHTPNPDLVKPELKGLSVHRKSASTADLTISFNALPYIRYELKRKSTSETSYTTVTDLKNQSGIVSYTFSNLPYFNLNYCFKVSAKDTCGNTIDSQELCDVSLTVTAKNQFNSLLFGFPPLDSLKSFNVYANGTLISSYSNTNFSNSFDHSNLICNQRYCYNTVSTYKPNDFISTSDTVCVKATSTNTPPSVTNLFSTITTNSPLVSWSFP